MKILFKKDLGGVYNNNKIGCGRFLFLKGEIEFCHKITHKENEEPIFFFYQKASFFQYKSKVKVLITVDFNERNMPKYQDVIKFL